MSSHLITHPVPPGMSMAMEFPLSSVWPSLVILRPSEVVSLQVGASQRSPRTPHTPATGLAGDEAYYSVTSSRTMLT